MDENLIIIEFKFSRLQHISDYVPGEPFSTSGFRITLSGEKSSNAIDQVGRQIIYVFELLEGSRLFVKEASRLSNSDQYATVGEIVEILRKSPLEILVETSPIMAEIIKLGLGVMGVAYFVSQTRAKLFQGNKEQALGRKAEAEANLAKEKTRLVGLVSGVIEQKFTKLEDSQKSVLEKRFETDVLDPIESMSTLDIEQGIIEPDVNE